MPASVQDTLPAGLTIVSMAGTNWNCSTVLAGGVTGTCSYLDADTALDATLRTLHPVASSTMSETSRTAVFVAFHVPEISCQTELVGSVAGLN